MRFVVTGEWRLNSLLKLVIVIFLFYIALFWVTNALLYFHKMGLTYSSVVEYYRGSEESFHQPRSYQGLLEVSHFHLFSMGVLILTLTHLVLFVPLRVEIKYWLILLSFVAALCNEAGGWLVRFVHPAFAYLKIASFLLLQGTLACLVIAVTVAVFINATNAYTEGRKFQ